MGFQERKVEKRRWVQRNEHSRGERRGDGCMRGEGGKFRPLVIGPL